MYADGGVWGLQCESPPCTAGLVEFSRRIRPVTVQP